MEPQQPYGSFPAPPPEGNPYDFITNPKQQPKPSGILPVLPGKSSFAGKLVLLIGGALVLIIVIALAVNFIFGGKTNLGTLLQLAETQQEIIRVSGLATGTITDDTISGAAINTQLSVTTQQQGLLVYLAKHRQKTDSKTLALKKDLKTDLRLNQAKATSTLDVVFAQVMRQEITDYAAEVKTNYSNATVPALKTLLAADYKQAQLLLKQWPEN